MIQPQRRMFQGRRRTSCREALECSRRLQVRCVRVVQWKRRRGLTRLCGQRFAYSRRAGKQHDHAFTFALDHIVKGLFVSHLTLSESKDKLFVILRENEAVERSVIVINFFHRGNGEGEPLLVSQRVAFERCIAQKQLLFSRCGQRRLFALTDSDV